jgi:hypothetical protein
MAYNAARFSGTDQDTGNCAHGEYYPQVGSERASTNELKSAKIRGWILRLNRTFIHGCRAETEAGIDLDVAWPRALY